MSLRKSDDFIADVERQFQWYVVNASWEIADRYLDAVEATCQLLGQHPQLGPLARIFPSAFARLAFHRRLPPISEAHFVL